MTPPQRILLSAACIALSLIAVQPQRVQAIEKTKAKISAAQEEADKTSAELSNKKAEAKKLQDRKEAVTKTLESFTNDLNEVADAVAELDDKISEKQAEIDEMDEVLTPLQEDLDDAENRLNLAKSRQSSQYTAMKKRIQYMYEHGDDSLYEVFLKSKSFADMLNKQEYIEKLTEYDREALDDYQETTEEVRDDEAEAKKKRDAVLAEKKKIEAAQSELEGLRSEQQEKQDEISELIAVYEGNIEMTEEQIKEAEKKADELQKELDEKNADIKNLEAQLKREQAMTEAAAGGTWTKAEAYQGTTSDRYLMANIIFCEAGNQPYEGQVAVGAVIMNRVRSSVCPNTISGVVYQKGQFEPVSTGRLALALARNDATESCYKAADAAMAGENPIGDCLFFRTPISGINYKYKIAGHIFY